MRLLVDDSLKFSIAGGFAEEREVNAGEALRFARSNLQAIIAEAGTIITSESLPSVAANFGGLAEVFQNLICERGQVPWPGRAADSHCVRAPRIGMVLSVADNGIGIAKYQEEVFLPLKRLHSQAEYPGTGFGLAICKRIVEAHGGRIRLDSTPAVGTTVYFAIPDLKRHNGGERAVMLRALTYPAGRSTIYVTLCLSLPDGYGVNSKWVPDGPSRRPSAARVAH